MLCSLLHLAYRLGHCDLKVIVIANCEETRSPLIFLSSKKGQLPKISKLIGHMLEASSCDK